MCAELGSELQRVQLLSSSHDESEDLESASPLVSTDGSNGASHDESEDLESASPLVSTDRSSGARIKPTPLDLQTIVDGKCSV